MKEWWESDEEYEARIKAESKTATDLMFSLVRLIINLGIMAVLFGPFFYASFLAAQKLLGSPSTEAKVWMAAILLFYIMYCIIYFLKGIIIALLSRSNNWWILPWSICVLLCCVIPAFFVKVLVGSMFFATQQKDTLCQVLSWGAFVLSFLLVYEMYKFKTPSAPTLFYWSYKWGLKSIKKSR